MASPRRPERNRAARSFRQLRRFHHVINSYKVFGTHRRPKRTTQPVSTAYLFYKVANEQVAIEIDGNEVMMTRWEALVRQVHTLALNRDPGASRLLHKMRKLFPGSAPPGDKYLVVVSDDDMKL